MNEDMNDELFRRAAESYPLITDNADWDVVLNKMNSNGTSDLSNPVVKNKKNNLRYLLLLLLLVPLTIFENNRSSMNEQPVGKINPSLNPTIVKKDVNQIRRKTVLKYNSNLSATNKTNSATKTVPVNSFEPVISQFKAPEASNSAQASNNINNNAVASSYKHLLSPKQRSKFKIINAPLSEVDEITMKNTKSTNKSKEKINVSVTNNSALEDEKQTNNPLKKEKESYSNPDINKAVKNIELLASETNKEIPVAEKSKKEATDTIPETTKKEIAKNNDIAKTKDIKKDKIRTKRFYIGLVAGPDFSAIKLQSLKKVGLNYGFLAGYRLTKKISIEAGLLQDRKYYSSNGKYFSTKNIYLYPNATIDHIDGVCKMLELPINASYTFSSRSGSNWFGSVGFSSYFMQNESYTYNIEHNGYYYPKDYDYKNKSTSLFAVINISAGYIRKLGKTGNLRIEPYIKLPVRKIGTGELPIQSGGVLIGFTKDIF